MKKISITLNLDAARPRLDQVLLETLREQNEHPELKSISRTVFKALFKEKRISIKGQNAITASALAQGSTQVDINLG